MLGIKLVRPMKRQRETREERMPTVWIQQGTVLNLIRPLARAKQRIAKLYKERGKDLFILSGNDSDHMMDSLHFIDQAFDFAINGMHLAKIKKVVEMVEEEEKVKGITHYFDVIKYPKRGIYHCEYDPW